MRTRITAAIATATLAGATLVVGTGSPAAADTGTVTVPDSVFYEGCVDVPYTYAYTLRPGYELENARLELTGPDGLESGTDSVATPATSGTSDVQVCRGELGTYTGAVDVLACTTSFSACYSFTVGTSFTMRNPNSRTGLVAKPKSADRGEKVKLVMSVFDERPAGYFASDDVWVRLQQYRGGAWRSVPGGKEFVSNGRAVVKVTMKENKARFRAVTRTTSGLNGSVSRTVTVR